MYQPFIIIPQDKSFFLFGPRGTGKTTWVKNNFPNALFLDLLEAEIYNEWLVNPQRLEKMIEAKKCVVQVTTGGCYLTI